MALFINLCFVSCEKEGGTGNQNEEIPQDEEFPKKNLKNSGNEGDKLELLWVGGVHYNGWNYDAAYVKLSFTGTNILNTGGSYCDAHIVSVGSVSGLSKVENVPHSGWRNSVEIQPGHGYVVRNQSNGSGSLTFLRYARVYVEDWITGATGNIIGVVVQYQDDWLIDY